MTLDLNKLEHKLDEALSNETSQTLNKFLNDKRMTNNKQQTAVDIIYQGMSDKIVMQDVNKALICIHISHDDFIKLHRQAKEMEKERTINFTEDWYFNGPLLGGGVDVKSTIEQHFNNTYGGGEQ